MQAALVTQPLAPAQRSARAVPPGAVCPAAVSHAQRVLRGPVRTCAAAATEVAQSAQPSSQAAHDAIPFRGVHHVGLLVEDLSRSLDFYCGTLGLGLNGTRPDDKLPYGGAWLDVGTEMIHLMELPSPDPTEGRPEHGGRDRHVCLGLADIQPLEDRLRAADIKFTRSKSGRAAIFFRDPDANVLECVELEPWR